MLENQKILFAHKSGIARLFKGGTPVYICLLLIAIVPLVGGGMYLTLTERDLLSAETINDYAQHIPAGKKIFRYQGNEIHITELQRKEMLQVGAFFSFLMLYVVFPLLLGWLLLVARFAMRNYPYTFPEDFFMSRNAILTQGIKHLFLCMLVVCLTIYTMFFDIHALLDEVYFMYMAAGFLLVVGVGGMFGAMASFLLIRSRNNR